VANWPRGGKKFTKQEVIDRFLTGLRRCRMIWTRAFQYAKDIVPA